MSIRAEELGKPGETGVKARASRAKARLLSLGLEGRRQLNCLGQHH